MTIDMNKFLQVVRTLPNRHKRVVVLYYHGYALDEIGERMRLTRERIRQIKEKSFRIIRRRYLNWGWGSKIFQMNCRKANETNKRIYGGR